MVFLGKCKKLTLEKDTGGVSFSNVNFFAKKCLPILVSLNFYPLLDRCIPYGNALLKFGHPVKILLHFHTGMSGFCRELCPYKRR